MPAILITNSTNPPLSSSSTTTTNQLLTATGHHLPHALQHHRASLSNHLSFERKCLLAATSATVIGLILMLVAVSTDYWLIVTNPSGTYITEDGISLLRLYSHSGVWRVCNIDLRNATSPLRVHTECRRHILFPSSDEADNRQLQFDQTSLNYTRSAVAFSTLGLIFMLLGQCFAFYSFKEKRYMFKRLTALLHFLSAVCILICVEVLVSAVNYEKAHLPNRHPAQALSHFGFSFVLACCCCGTFFAAGITFLAFSGKPSSSSSSSQTKPATIMDPTSQECLPLNAVNNGDSTNMMSTTLRTIRESPNQFE